MVKKIFVIDGNIASGKTTLIGNIKNKLYFHSLLGCSVLTEPIEQWDNLKTTFGSILEAVYNEPNKYTFLLQLQIIITYTNELIKCLKKNDYIITERSYWAFLNVFTKMAHNKKYLNDNEVYILTTLNKQMYDLHVQKGVVFYTIYVDTPVNICNLRKNKRNRKGEECITIDYLQDVHNYYSDLRLVNSIYIHKTVDDTIKYILSKMSLSHKITRFIFKRTESLRIKK